MPDFDFDDHDIDVFAAFASDMILMLIILTLPPLTAIFMNYDWSQCNEYVDSWSVVLTKQSKKKTFALAFASSSAMIHQPQHTKVHSPGPCGFSMVIMMKGKKFAFSTSALFSSTSAIL